MSRTRKRTKPRPRSSAVELSLDDAIQLGIGLQQKGDIPGAAEIYRSILAGHPDDVNALHFLGIAEHQLGRSNEALTLIERAITLAPQHPDLHNNHGNILKRLGRAEEAEAAYTEVLKLRPDDANALNNLGTIFRDKGQLPEALDNFKKVLSLQPDHYEAHLNLGYVLRSMNRLDEAIEIHQKALRLRPHQAGAYRELGAVYYAMGRIEESASIYRLWLERDPEQPVALHMLAACTGQGVPGRASDDFVRQSFDSFASHFDSSLAKLKYRAPELVAQAVARVIAVPDGSLTVLDIGCGTGLCASHLRPYAKHLVGVDLSEKMLEQATKRNLYDKLVPAELTEYLEHSKAAYELIVSADTLVYFGPLEAVAAAASASLRPGGHLIFTVESSAEHEVPEGYTIHPHGRYSHSEGYLRRVLGDAMLQVTDLQPVELRMEAMKPVPGHLVTAKKLL